jgi:hypothetical protein
VLSFSAAISNQTQKLKIRKATLWVMISKVGGSEAHQKHHRRAQHVNSHQMPRAHHKQSHTKRRRRSKKDNSDYRNSYYDNHNNFDNHIINDKDDDDHIIKSNSYDEWLAVVDRKRWRKADNVTSDNQQNVTVWIFGMRHAAHNRTNEDVINQEVKMSLGILI